MGLACIFSQFEIQDFFQIPSSGTPPPPPDDQELEIDFLDSKGGIFPSHGGGATCHDDSPVPNSNAPCTDSPGK